MRKILVSALAGIASLTSLAAPPPGEAAFPGANGRIVYTTAEDPADPGPWIIATMAVDGSDRRPLTSSSQHGEGLGDGRPAWSPGGTLIVFARYDAEGYGDIWIMKPDGSGQKRLTSHAGHDDWPGFSADGSRIVFSSDRTGYYDVYSMKLDGTDVRRLTTSGADDLDPVWSPNNDKIAFISTRRGIPEIFTMNPNGSGVTRITTATAEGDYSPDWSPDGSTIVFSRRDATGDMDLRRIDVATKVEAAIVGTSEGEDFPAYAPDSSASPPNAVVYTGYSSSDDYDIFVRSSTSPGTPANLSADSAAIFGLPNWQPIPVFPLVDVKFSPFKADIEWAFAQGITTGCTAELFCADAFVTREQMASFLVRALDLPATPTDFFTDDETSVHENDINRVAAAGITTGCQPNLYCPAAFVSRGQMTAFLHRAVD
jgi:dipeptidyl aminopeptidase/acylaminoacyl peptidase